MDRLFSGVFMSFFPERTSNVRMMDAGFSLNIDAPKRVLVNLFLLFLSVCLGTSLGQSQEIPKNGLAFFSILPKPVAARISIGSNTIISAQGEEALGPGAYTGVFPWKPEGGILKIEAKGYPPLEKKPFLKTGEFPLLVLREISGGTLDLLVVPNAKNRSPSFYDAINLSSQANLTLQANQKEFALPHGQKVRLTTEKSLNYSLGKTTFEPITPEENGNFLLIFYTDSEKTVRCIVTRDDIL